MNDEEESNITTSLDDLWAQIETEDKELDSNDLVDAVTKETQLDVSDEIHVSEKLLSVETPIEFLKKLSFKNFIAKANVQKTVYRGISDGIDGNWIPFESIGEYWESNSEEQNTLLKLPGFGRKSKFDLDQIIKDLIANPSELKLMVNSDQQKTSHDLLTANSLMEVANNHEVLEHPLLLLESLSFKQFVENVDISKRGYNSIVAAIQGNEIKFASIGEYWASSSEEQNALLKLPGFGTLTKSIFDDEIRNLLDNPSKLKHLVTTDHHSTNIHEFRASSSLENTAITQGLDVKPNCDDPSLLTELHVRLIGAISDKNYNILIKRAVAGETLEDVGKPLGVTRERVRQLEKSSLQKINKLFSHEIQCLAQRLESLITEAGGVLLIDECIYAFPEINPVEFIILYTAYGINPNATLYREKELLWLKTIYRVRAKRDEQVFSAFLSSHWPPSISKIASQLVDIPRPYVEYSLKKKYSLEIDNGIVVSKGRLKKQDQLTFVLRKIGEPAHVEEIQNSLNALFGTSDSLHNIEGNLSRRDDVLLSGSRTFCLYETLGMSDASIREIRDKAFSYITKVGDYVRANILYEALFHYQTFDGILVTPYNLLGILQDDARYITKPGLIIGLKTFGDTWQLQDAIEEIVRNYGPIHTREVLRHLPENRMVPEVTVSTVLRDHSAFIRVKPGTYDTIDRVFGSNSQEETLVTQIRNELVRQNESEVELYNRHIDGKFSTLSHFAFRTLLERNFKFDTVAEKFGLN